MAERSVRFHPLAADEAEAARRWYYERNASLSNAFRHELDAAVQNIADGPERWPTYPGKSRRYLLHRFPYSVVYRLRADVVEVMAVAHHRRRPGYWRDRLGRAV
ncbi:MAG: type II toxin-antitoxin system RelE/ParE family toxin [Proteobacteria bacterium]|nr:type II toxin-antitoxin system RelE/ParE family toxin [Pseudomonadota bacterium]